MSAEIRAGIVALLAVASLVGSIIFLRGGIEFRDRGYDLYVVVANAGGMTVGAPVQMAGVEVGRVTRLDLTAQRRAQITIRIRQGVSIPTGSRFAIASSGLLGDRLITISPEPGDPAPIEPGTIVTGVDPFTIDELFDRVVVVARRAEDTLISLNRLISDPALATSLTESARNAREITIVMRRVAENVERTTRALDRTVGAVGAEVPRIAAQLRAMSTDLAESAQRVEALARDVAADGETARQVRATVTSIERAAGGVEKMVRDLQGLINEDEVRAVRASLDEARRTVSEVRQTVSEVRQGVGEGRALIGRASSTIQRIQQVIPEKIEIPTLRNIARLEYGLWYDGRRLGNDVTLTLLPDAPTNYILALREYAGTTRFGIQAGTVLANRFRIRYGLIDSNLGVGLDYSATPQLSYALDLYNINQVTLNVYLKYALAQNYGLTLRGLNLLHSPTVGGGIYIRF